VLIDGGLLQLEVGVVELGAEDGDLVAGVLLLGAHELG
jgi:hypothetical protein